MKNELQIMTDENALAGTIENFLDIAGEVPWGNSDFQNRQAIVNMELTPERAYRHASLRIMNRLQALNECYFNRQKDEIQIERLKRKAMAGGDDLDRREAELEVRQIESRRPYTDKLIRDAIREIESLAPIIQRIGRLSREQFEAAEPEHFRRRYLNQAHGKGDAILGLEAMGVSLATGQMLPQHAALFDRIAGGGREQQVATTQKKELSE